MNDRKTICSIIKLILIIGWMNYMRRADSYLASYILIFILAIAALVYNDFIDKKKAEETVKKHNKITAIFAVLFSLMTTSANYMIFFSAGSRFGGGIITKIYKAVVLIVMLAGSYLAGESILVYVKRNTDKLTWKPRERTKRFYIVFLVVFLIISIINLIILWYIKYPGILTPDSVSQIEQSVTGEFVNHHPVYHTLLIKLFIDLGLKIFGTFNAGVFMYHVFQILIMAAIMAYSIETLYIVGAPILWIIIASSCYALMPYHIMYSMTMWKDVLFGGVSLLLVVSIIRYILSIGNRTFALILGGLSVICFCLFRSNGIFAFVFTLIALALLFYKKEKKLVITMALCLVVSFAMKHAVLSALNIPQADTIESLSIPAQQIARVIVEDGGELTEAETELIGEVVDIEEVKSEYKTYISDPVKGLVRKKGNMDVISDRKWDFIKAYFSIGLRNPVAYTAAWIDQTKGYYNSGYEYWRWRSAIEGNRFDIERITRSDVITRVLDKYQEVFVTNPILRLFLAIGLHTWIVLLILYAAIIRSDKLTGFSTVPLLAVVLSLLVATPVFCEFRYAYSMFCVLPFLLVFSARRDLQS